MRRQWWPAHHLKLMHRRGRGAPPPTPAPPPIHSSLSSNPGPGRQEQQAGWACRQRSKQGRQCSSQQTPPVAVSVCEHGTLLGTPAAPPLRGGPPPGRSHLLSFAARLPPHCCCLRMLAKGCLQSPLQLPLSCLALPLGTWRHVEHALAVGGGGGGRVTHCHIRAGITGSLWERPVGGGVSSGLGGILGQRGLVLRCSPWRDRASVGSGDVLRFGGHRTALGGIGRHPAGSRAEGTSPVGAAGHMLCTGST